MEGAHAADRGSDGRAVERPWDRRVGVEPAGKILVRDGEGAVRGMVDQFAGEFVAFEVLAPDGDARDDDGVLGLHVEAVDAAVPEGAQVVEQFVTGGEGEHDHGAQAGRGLVVVEDDHAGASGKTVALRVTVTDGNGATVTQVTQAAYAVR